MIILTRDYEIPNTNMGSSENVPNIRDFMGSILPIAIALGVHPQLYGSTRRSNSPRLYDSGVIHLSQGPNNRGGYLFLGSPSNFYEM